MIEVIIPTYNHSEFITVLLEEAICTYSGTEFCFNVLDSSNSDDTEKIMKDYKVSCLKYKRIPSDVKPDIKVLNAIQECKNDYFYVMGDGVLLDFNKIEQILVDGKYNKYSLIELDNIIGKNYRNDPTPKKEVLYSIIDIDEYLVDHFSHLTFWGASIVFKPFFQLFLNSGSYIKYLDNQYMSWWLPCGIVESYNTRRRNERVEFGLVYSDSIKNNPNKKLSSWASNRSYFEIAYRLFDKCIDIIPEEFDSRKSIIIKNFRHDQMGTKRLLLKLRIDGTVCFRYLMEYSSDIWKTKDIYLFMLFLCIIPRRFLYMAAKMMRKSL